MEARDFRILLQKHPKSVRSFLAKLRTRYITIYYIHRCLGIGRPEAKELMYELMDDGVIEKYLTTFRISEDFWRERSKI